MYTSLSQAFRRIYAEEGLRGVLLPGMTASMIREATYSSIRVGTGAKLWACQVVRDSPTWSHVSLAARRPARR